MFFFSAAKRLSVYISYKTIVYISLNTSSSFYLFINLSLQEILSSFRLIRKITHFGGYNTQNKVKFLVTYQSKKNIFR